MPYYELNNTPDPDYIDSPMVGLAINQHPTAHGEQAHQKGQLLYCNKGVIHFYCQGRYFLLPPSKAAWIPPGLKHDVHSITHVSYRSLYIDVKEFLPLPKQMQILQVEPLLKCLIEKCCSFEPGYSKNSHEFRMASVIIDAINAAIELPLSLPIPTEKRLLVLFHSILKAPGETKTVNDYAKLINITPRTLNRITQKEIGMSFEKWRLELRLMHAFELLDCGYSITQISQSLGYSNDSSFIARFKQWVGETPAKYRQKIRSA